MITTQETKMNKTMGTYYANNINLDFLPTKLKRVKHIGKHVCFASDNIIEWCEKWT